MASEMARRTSVKQATTTMARNPAVVAARPGLAMKYSELGSFKTCTFRDMHQTAYEQEIGMQTKLPSWKMR